MPFRPFLPVLLLLAALPGCRPSYSPDTYASGAVQQAAKVEQGVVAGIRKVVVSPDGTLGATTGAAVGGIGGAQAPGGGVRTALTALSGSVVGGLVGSGIERATGETPAFEYIVRKGNGEMVSVTQRDLAPLALGQRVLVIAGLQARVVPDYTAPNAPVTELPATPAAAAPATPATAAAEPAAVP